MVWNWSRKMRWVTKKAVVPPTEGNIRIKIKFAFLPKDCDGITVWLEKYRSIQQYKSYIAMAPAMGYKSIRWVEVRREYGTIR
jgi:hypothetical protein